MNKDSFTFTMYSSVEELSMVSQSPHQRTLNFLLGPCNYQKCLQNDYCDVLKDSKSCLTTVDLGIIDTFQFAY